MSLTEFDPFAEHTVGHRELRRAFALLVRTRALLLALAALWIVEVHLVVTPDLDPGAMRLVAGAAAAAVLTALLAWFAATSWPVIAALGHAAVATAGTGLAASHGLAFALPAGLAALGWLLLVPLVRARLLLIQDPNAAIGLRRFDRLTRGNRYRRMQRSFAGALLITLVLVGWYATNSYTLGRVPDALEPVCAAFESAWNADGDDPLRVIVTQSNPAGFTELTEELAAIGEPGRRPAIQNRTTVRAYDTRTTIVYTLASGARLKTYWERRADGWELDFLQVAR